MLVSGPFEARFCPRHFRARIDDSGYWWIGLFYDAYDMWNDISISIYAYNSFSCLKSRSTQRSLKEERLKQYLVQIEYLVTRVGSEIELLRRFQTNPSEIWAFQTYCGAVKFLWGCSASGFRGNADKIWLSWQKYQKWAKCRFDVTRVGSEIELLKRFQTNPSEFWAFQTYCGAVKILLANPKSDIR